MAEDFKEIRVARGTDFMPVGVISTHFASSPYVFKNGLCHKHNVNSIIKNKITDCNSLFLCFYRTNIEERFFNCSVLCVTTLIDNNQVNFSKMTGEKFVGSGVLLAAHNRRKREVVSLSEMQTLPWKERRSHYQ